MANLRELNEKINMVNNSNEKTSVANKENFFIDSFAKFEEVDTIISDYDFISEGGSKYKYTNEGVYRTSDHWGKDIATCKWFLGNQETNKTCFDFMIENGCIEKTGFCSWDNFKLYKDVLIKVEELYNIGIRNNRIVNLEEIA